MDKGFLLGEETLKIIIAVVCLGFLVVFLTKLYFSGDTDQDLKDAQAVIERVEEIIKGNVTIENVDALSPSGWHVFGFIGGEIKPDSCAEINCLCICDKKLFGSFGNIQEEECTENGVCLILEDLQSFEDFKIQKSGASSLIIDKTNGLEVYEK